MDGSGNVFIADASHNVVKEITVASGYTAVNTLGSGFSFPWGVAVDGSGNVYVDDQTNNAVKQIVAAGGYTTVNTLATGLTNLHGLAVDGSGNVYPTQSNEPTNSIKDVLKLDTADAPAFTFGSLSIGSDSAAQSVVLQNFGNATLASQTAQAISIPSGFMQVAGSGTPTDCNAITFALNPGAGCNISIEFQPAIVGGYSGNALINDNALNNLSAQQMIALSGNGTVATTSLTLTASPLSPSTYQSVTLTATLSPFSVLTDTTNTENISFTINGIPAGTSSLNNGVATLNTTALHAGSNSVIATYNTDGNFASATSNTLTYVVTQASQTITFGSLADKFTTDPPFTVSATGGNSGNPVDFFAAGTTPGWTTGASMGTALQTAVAGAPGDGMIYVAGGLAAGVRINTLQQYNPALNTWTTKASMPTAVYQAAAASIGGLFYVAGGWDSSVPSTHLQIYTPYTNSWTTGASMSHLSACGLGGAINNNLYVFTACNGNSGYFALLDVYDPVANSWTSLTSGPIAHSSGAGGVINNKLYVVGGLDGSGNLTAELDVYDPSVPGWTTKHAMPVALAGISGDVIDGKLYVVGGNDNASPTNNYFNTVYVYDPVADSWTLQAASMPTALTDAAAVAFGGALYVAGGNNSTPYLNTLQILNTNQCTVPSGNLVNLTGSPGTCTITAYQAGNNDYLDATPVSQSFNITVAPITKLVYGTSPATPINAGGNAGSAITVLEQSAGGTTQPTGADLITLTVTGPAGFTTAVHTATAVNGIATFNLAANALTIAGTYTYTATFAALTPAVATEIVNPGITTHFSVVASPSSTTATAGTGILITVTAQDSFNNTTPSYSGIVHLTSTDAAAFLGANSTLTSGVGTFPATFKTAGSQTITATDTVAATITGTTVVITVSPGATASYRFTAPATATAGAVFNFIVTATDNLGNTTPAYTGTIHFTSTDGAAVLPANYTFVAGDAGVHTFSVTLNTVGSEFVTVADTVTSSIATAHIIVNPGPATHFTLSAPSPAAAGTAFNFTVTAFDASNNIATGYTGIAHFTSTDAAATLPANYTFLAGDNGVHTFSATLKTAPSQTITATDTVTGTITGTTSAITVTPAAASRFSVSSPGIATAGVSFSVSVTALDAFNNTATTYAGTVHFTSSDGTAVLPANSTLTSGTGSFAVTLKTAGSQTITATDTVTPAITGFATVTVSAAAATHYTVSAPGTATAGTAISISVTAFDPFNNIATGYRGIAHFTSTDAVATLPADYTFLAADNGVHVFSATLKTAGSKTITATDTVTGSITGVTAAIIVSAGANAQFAFANPSPVIAGTPFNVTITAEDAFGNVNTTYAGTHPLHQFGCRRRASGQLHFCGWRCRRAHLLRHHEHHQRRAAPRADSYRQGHRLQRHLHLRRHHGQSGRAHRRCRQRHRSREQHEQPHHARALWRCGRIRRRRNQCHARHRHRQRDHHHLYANAQQRLQRLQTASPIPPPTSPPPPRRPLVSITINKIPVTVTLGNLSPTYNGLPHSATATTAITSSGTPVTVSSITFTYNGSSTPPTAVLAGGYAVVATVVDPIYIGTGTGTLNIGKAALTITGSTLSKVYGAAIPSLNGTYSGQQNGDTFTVTGATTATVLSPVVAGGYATVPAATGTNLADYTVTPVNGTLTIIPADTSAALTVGTQNALAGQNNTYTATITSLTSGTPTGSVQFLENGSVFGAATLVNGQATLTSAALGAGTYSITIAYSGDNNFNPNIAASAVVVDVNLPDFTFTVSTPPVVVMQFGGTAAFTMHLIPQTGSFYRDVDFTVTGNLPLDAVITLSPNPILAGSGTTDVTFTVTTTKLAWYRNSRCCRWRRRFTLHSDSSLPAA